MSLIVPPQQSSTVHCPALLQVMTQVFEHWISWPLRMTVSADAGSMWNAKEKAVIKAHKTAKWKNFFIGIASILPL